MENDYLWNKTGKDAEIEQWEKTLQVFRYQKNKPPRVFPAVSVEKPAFSLYRLSFAVSFAACLVILFSGIAVWLNYSSNKKFAAINQVQSVELPTLSPPQRVDETPLKSVVLPTKPETAQKPKSIQTAFRAKSLSSQLKRRAKPRIRLTEEEKYAYRQLMLALSITGSKLKEVQAKVNNSEPTDSIR